MSRLVPSARSYLSVDVPHTGIRIRCLWHYVPDSDIVVSVPRSKGSFWRLCKRIAVLFDNLPRFFSVAIDALNNYLSSLEFFFDIVEDGGKMIVMSIVVWFVHVLGSNPEFVNDAGRRKTVRSFR